MGRRPCGGRKSLELLGVEAGELRYSASGVLFENLDQTEDEELLLLWGCSLPVVRLDDGDDEANCTGTLLILLILGSEWRSIGEGLDCVEVV